MTHSDLEKKAAELGFQTIEPGPRGDANKTLAEVVQSHDPRFWEAFPVMLANTAEAGEFSLEAVNGRLEEEDRELLRSLIFISLGLYKSLGMKFSWTKGLFGGFADRVIAGFSEKMRLNSGLELGQLRLLPERLKENLLGNFKGRRGPVRNTAESAEKLDLEFAVSEIFTPRQKELLLKKLRRKKMTKTEKEYFSRVIKKKAQALANEDLHRLARKVLE